MMFVIDCSNKATKEAQTEDTDDTTNKVKSITPWGTSLPLRVSSTAATKMKHFNNIMDFIMMQQQKGREEQESKARNKMEEEEAMEKYRDKELIVREDDLKAQREMRREHETAQSGQMMIMITIMFGNYGYWPITSRFTISIEK